MQRATAQVGLQRLVTGVRCEVQGCYELALWLVTSGPETSHWCAKHTRARMVDAKYWKRRLTAKLDA